MKNFYFCFLILFLAGCMQDLTGEDVRLVFPEPPAQVKQRFGEPAWEIRFSGGGGMPRSVRVPAGASSMSVHIAPGPPVSIACYMVFGEQTDLFFPGGGLFPHDVDEGGLDLAWEKGFAASFLIRLEEQGYPVANFNSGRFFRETLLRAEGNPWALNEELIIGALTTLSFRADRIKPLPAHPVSLNLPGGIWLPRNLLAPPAQTNEEGLCDLGYMPEGYHRYYRLDGNEKLDIQLDGEGLLYIITE